MRSQLLVMMRTAKESNGAIDSMFRELQSDYNLIHQVNHLA